MNRPQRKCSLPSLVVALCSLLILGGCVTTAKQKMLDSGLMPLSDQELQLLLSEPTDVSYSGGKGPASINHFPDGTQKITYQGGADEGTWRIANGEICGKWEKIRKGVEKCSTIFKIDENKYKLFKKNGSSNGVITFN